MKNTIFLILLAFLLFLSIFFYWRNSSSQQALAAANDRITSLEQQLRSAQSAAPAATASVRPDSASAAPATAEDDKDVPPPSAAFVDELGSLSEGDVQKLQRQGLKNPEADLMNDLMRRQKTILTATGSMGGNMAIRDIRILNDRYAMAYFEDGHNGGYLLLRYNVTDGNIGWTRLDASTL